MKASNRWISPDERGRSRQSAAEKVDRAGRQNCDNPRKERRDSFTTIHYYRELGPTAIAPGHKQIAVKVHQNQSSAGSPQSSGLLNLPSKPDPHLSVGPTTGAFDGPLPIFEEESSLPVEDLLPSLLDAFFLYYADSFCFLNRSYLDRLLSRGEASPFLVCSIATLSSRFCNPQIFTMFYSSKADGSRREAWEYSVPFLERAKTLMTPLIGIPSCDVIAGMLLLSLAEFGNNSESGESRMGFLGIF